MQQTSLDKNHCKHHKIIGIILVLGVLGWLAALLIFLSKLYLQLNVSQSPYTQNLFISAAVTLGLFLVNFLIMAGYFLYFCNIFKATSRKTLQVTNQLQEQEEKYRLIGERYKMIIDNSDIAIFEYDCQTKLYTSFENCENLFQKSREQINADLAHTRYLDETETNKAVLAYFYHLEDLPYVTKFSKLCLSTGQASFDARMLKADGSTLWCHAYISILEKEKGQPYKILGLFIDIDKNKREAELLRFQVERDPLTQFYNKTATVGLVSKRLNEDNGVGHSMLLLDIDHFKEINDTMGHLAGDALISEISHKLKQIFRSNDILGRVGGDEFVIFVSGLCERNHLRKKAKEITEAFADLTFTDCSGQTITVSIGITTTVAVGTTYEKLFNQADKALYEAKKSGRNLAIFYTDNMAFSKSYLNSTDTPTKQ